ncbi:MAG: FHA domain-containing protein [Candidatus Methanoperedens sp.]|nr:FHA domain-containing protein [Candidatus Methanoperedens sp.]
MSYIFITIMSGAEDGKVFEFESTPIVLGRHEKDDVYLRFDNKVSRHHARITKEKVNYFIEDVGPEGKGSANKTYIIEDKAAKLIPPRSPTIVFSGAILKLGPVWLKFECKDDIKTLQKDAKDIRGQFEEAGKKLSKAEFEKLFNNFIKKLQKVEKTTEVEEIFKVINEMKNELSKALETPPPEPIRMCPAEVNDQDLQSIRNELILFKEGLKKHK